MEQEKKEKEIYCTECGEKMFTFECESEKIIVGRYDSGGGTKYRLDSPFNPDGTRNYAKVYQCPQYKKPKFWETANHQLFCIYKGEMHYPENL